MAGGIVVSPEISLHSRHTSHIRYQLKHILVINIAGYGVVSRAFPGVSAAGQRRYCTGGSRSKRGARATAAPMCDVTQGPSVPGGPGFQTIKTPPSNAWAGNNPGLLTNVLIDSPELALLSWSGKQLSPPFHSSGPRLVEPYLKKIDRLVSNCRDLRTGRRKIQPGNHVAGRAARSNNFQRAGIQQQ